MNNSKLQHAKVAVIGLITGFANGIFGAGGGTILVPALQKFLGIQTHKSHATAIAVILPLSVLSAFIYVRGGQADWNVIFKISIGGLAGGFVGAKLLNKITANSLHKIFGAFMVVAAIRMFF